MSLSPSGKVCICPGDQLLFTCRASSHNDTSPQIDWLIQFEAPDRDLSDIQQTYISEDHLGDVVTDNQEEYTFTFNLTYKDNTTSLLMSTLVVTIASNISTSHQACNEEQNEETILYINIRTGTKHNFSKLNNATS